MRNTSRERERERELLDREGRELVRGL